jgi:hypothetical protein
MRTEYAARLYHRVGYQHRLLFSEHTPIHTAAQYATSALATPRNLTTCSSSSTTSARSTKRGVRICLWISKVKTSRARGVLPRARRYYCTTTVDRN